MIQTRYDETILPYTSSFLRGPRKQLTNVLLQRRCPASRIGHVGIAFLPLQWVVHALRRDGPASRQFKPRCG